MQNVEQLVDPTLGPLLREDFDDTAFVKGVLDTQGTEACLAALSSGSQVLGAELGDQVSARYEQLLSEVHAVQALEAKLLRNNERVDSLMQAVRRIRAQCSEPYARMQQRVTQLDRMQQSADILRSVQRLLYQCRKLRESAAALDDGAAGAKPAAGHAAASGIAVAADLPRVALSIREVEEILAESDLHGIALVDEQLPFLKRTAARLREQAHALLQAGVREQNQALTGVALQVLASESPTTHRDQRKVVRGTGNRRNAHGSYLLFVCSRSISTSACCPPPPRLPRRSSPPSCTPRCAPRSTARRRARPRRAAARAPRCGHVSTRWLRNSSRQV